MATESAPSSKGIVWLGAQPTLDPWHYGAKASALNDLASRKTPIAPGFCVPATTVSRIANSIPTDEDIKILRHAFSVLITSAERQRLIVRSSSSLESGSRFSGLFKTILDVQTFDALVVAISAIYNDSSSTDLKRYARDVNVKIPHSHLAILVQQQIEQLYSAMLYRTNESSLWEIFRGNLTDGISGQRKPTLFARSNPDGVLDTRIVNNPQKLTSSEIAHVKSQLNYLMDLCPPTDGASLVLEAGITRLGPIVFQYTRTRHKFELRMTDTPIIPRLFLAKSKSLGLKAAAAGYFSARGLQSSPTFVLTSNNFQRVWSRVKSNGDPVNHDYTVRFSKGFEIGLPRYFVHSLEDAGLLISKHLPEVDAALVHRTIRVDSSFELLVSSDYALLEHIPGMWESDNTLPPDVFLLHASGSISVYRWSEQRNAKFSLNNPAKLVPSISTETVSRWAKELRNVVRQFRKDFAGELPLNFHFVAEPNGKWHFLNIRRGFGLTPDCIQVAKPHVVSGLDDLETWDKSSPLLLRVATQRGKEKDILRLARELPADGRVIYVDFGLLSHPAMVLRDYGLNIQPLYFTHGLSAELGYQHMELPSPVDQGLDPVTRIMGECPIVSDDRFQIVCDREPVTDHHLLVVSKQAANSFGDCYDNAALPSTLGKLGELPVFRKHGWIFYERGRARFCTSKFTREHAHGHIFPADYFDSDVLPALAAEIDAKRVSDLGSALDMVRNSPNEYVLLLDNNGHCYLSSPSPIPQNKKRFVRTFLTSRRRRADI